jgi:hypothetical protein
LVFETVKQKGENALPMLGGSLVTTALCPQIADGGEGLQIWRVAADILNKELQTANKGWSSALGVGHAANNSSPQEISLFQKITRSLRPRIPLINNLRERDLREIG